MKKTESKEDYLVLDKETNALEDKVFQEWIERANNSSESNVNSYDGKQKETANSYVSRLN